MKRKRGARLGQHFLTGQWAARALARAAEIKPDESVLEIGPGTGALTRELLATGGRVVAIEKDEMLIGRLRKDFANALSSDTLMLVAADIRDIVLEKLGLKNGRYVVAANIPYYITGEIIRLFLTAQAQPHTMALLVQKEVAQRIVADRGSILSLSVKAYGTPKVVAKVSRGNFSPPPSVDSAILVISKISRKFFSELDEELFFKVVRAGFSSKRKLLASNLTTVFGLPGQGKEAVARAFSVCGIDPKARAEELFLEQWKCLTKNLTAIEMTPSS